MNNCGVVRESGQPFFGLFAMVDYGTMVSRIRTKTVSKPYTYCPFSDTFQNPLFAKTLLCKILKIWHDV
jgi:hypothetical protein